MVVIFTDLKIYKSLDEKAKAQFVQKYSKANKDKKGEKDISWTPTFQEEVTSLKSELHQGKDKFFLRLSFLVLVICFGFKFLVSRASCLGVCLLRRAMCQG